MLGAVQPDARGLAWLGGALTSMRCLRLGALALVATLTGASAYKYADSHHRVSLPRGDVGQECAWLMEVALEVLLGSGLGVVSAGMVVGRLGLTARTTAETVERYAHGR